MSHPAPLRGLKVITPPTIEPVTLAEIRANTGINQASDTIVDAAITRRISEARDYAEKFMRRAICKQVVELRLDAFERVIELPMPPVQSIVSVSYIDTNGDEQTVSAADYVLYDFDDVPTLTTAYDVDWPDTRAEKNAVRIQYICGYGTSALAAAQSVTGISVAAPGVVSKVAHGYTDGDIVLMAATGMTEVDGKLYRVYRKSTDAFNLANLKNNGGLSTLGYTAFTAGTMQKVALDVPDIINDAIMLMVGHWTNYQNQVEHGVVLGHIPMSILSMLAAHKVYRL